MKIRVIRGHKRKIISRKKIKTYSIIALINANKKKIISLIRKIR